MDDDYDELDDIIMQKPTEGERVKNEHAMLDKAASHPTRRKMVKTIGAFGKPEDQLKAELEIDDNTFKYHMDFLKSASIVVIKENIYRLTDAGIDLLAATEHHREI